MYLLTLDGRLHLAPIDSPQVQSLYVYLVRLFIQQFQAIGPGAETMAKPGALGNSRRGNRDGSVGRVSVTYHCRIPSRSSFQGHGR